MPLKFEVKRILTTNEAAQISAKAGNAASFLAQSSDLTAQFNHAVEVKFEDQLSTAAIHFSLMEHMAEHEEMSFDMWPEVGSIEGHTGNKPFDLFRYKNPEGRETDGSFWRVVAERHPVGKLILDERSMVSQSQQENVKNRYSTMPEHERKRAKADLDGKFTTFYGKLRMAVQLYHQMRDVHVRLPSVTVGYDTNPVIGNDGKAVIGKDGRPETEINRKSPRLIMVQDATNAARAMLFSIPNFLRLSVDKTLAGDKTYGTFITSNKREKPPETPPEFHVNSPVAFETATSKELHYLEAARKDAKDFRALIAYYSENGADDRVKTLVNLHDALSLILEHKDVKVKVDALTMGTETAKAAA